eukprot:1162016-Pelagomonas_calceolata.AAC.4
MSAPFQAEQQHARCTTGPWPQRHRCSQSSEAAALTHRSVHSCRMLLRLLWDTRASASSASTCSGTQPHHHLNPQFQQRALEKSMCRTGTPPLHAAGKQQRWLATPPPPPKLACCAQPAGLLPGLLHAAASAPGTPPSPPSGPGCPACTLGWHDTHNIDDMSVRGACRPFLGQPHAAASAPGTSLSLLSGPGCPERTLGRRSKCNIDDSKPHAAVTPGGAWQQQMRSNIGDG